MYRNKNISHVPFTVCTHNAFLGDSLFCLIRPYHIVDLKFIEIDTLVALIYREADASSTETLQWFVFIPLEEGLSDDPELAPLSVSLASSNLADVLLRWAELLVERALNRVNF